MLLQKGWFCFYVLFFFVHPQIWSQVQYHAALMLSSTPIDVMILVALNLGPLSYLICGRICQAHWRVLASGKHNGFTDSVRDRVVSGSVQWVQSQLRTLRISCSSAGRCLRRKLAGSHLLFYVLTAVSYVLTACLYLSIASISSLTGVDPLSCSPLWHKQVSNDSDAPS